MRAFFTVLLLVCSNIFMTMAWYGHLKMGEFKWFSKLSLVAVVFISWGIALFEYFCMVPANKIGFDQNGGPFSIWQLKVIQEAITLTVFVCFTLLVFKTETFKWNHAVGFGFLIVAVFFLFKK